MQRSPPQDAHICKIRNAQNLSDTILQQKTTFEKVDEENLRPPDD